jgi:hypothetical protein
MINILKKLSLVMLGATALASCEKAEVKDGGGETLVRLLGGGGDPVVYALDLDPATETIEILDIRRDATGSSDLNKPATITLTNSQAFLDAYNDEHETSYQLLPADAWTVTPESGVTISGDTWTVNLAAGEFARQVSVTLDKTKFDLSKSYAFGLQVTGTTVGRASLVTGNAVVNVLIKNRYDGVYEVTGEMEDAGGLTGYFPMQYELVTSGATRVDGRETVEWGDYYIAVYNGADVSGYGTFSPQFIFDADGNITAVTNRYGQPAAGNGRYAALDPSGINKWDEATGNIDVKFFMYQPSVVALPNPRVKFDWHLEYKGPR